MDTAVIWVTLIEGFFTALIVIAALGFAYAYFVKKNRKPGGD